MKKVLKSLLCFVLILAMSVPVFAANSTDKGLSNEPYDYGLVPFSEEWDKLSTPERKAIFVIPEEVAEGLTTRALLETILNNPYFCDIYAFCPIKEGIKSYEKILGISYLYDREDCEEVLNDYIQNASFIRDENGDFDFNYWDSLKGYNEFKQYYNKVEKVIDVLILKIVFEEIYFQKGVMNKINFRYTDAFVYTPYGTGVPVKANFNWYEAALESGESPYIAGYWNYNFAVVKSNEILQNYPNVVLVYNPNCTYNCHSYAWYWQSSYNIYWMPSPLFYTIDTSYTHIASTNAVVGNRITYAYSNNTPNYFYDDSIKHSGIVYSINSGVKIIESKWGLLGVYRHQVTDCPYIAESDTIDFWNQAIY